MTVWGGEQQHEVVGVNVFNDGYDTNTPSINVYADYYVRSVNWGFSDNQTLNCSGSVGGTFNFNFNVGGGVVDVYIGRLVIFGQGQNYGGGPTYRFFAQISGQYLGGTPYVDYYWALPPRPANVPTNPGCSVSQVTNNSAYVTVTASDGRGSGVDAYSAQVSLAGGSWSGTSASWSGGSGTATGLIPATVYEARAQAHNAVGWSGFTYSGQFTTGATVPNAPTAIANNTVDQSTANVTWTAPANNGGSAITGYELQYATNSGFTANLKSLTFSGSPAALSGLTPGTTYFARVRAKNAVGSSAFSGTTSFTTLTGTPTIVSPAASASLAVPSPAFVISAQGVASDRTITVQISQDNTFATVFKTLTLSGVNKSANDQYTLSDATMYLKTGTWYARAQVKNNTTAYTTPWSATRTFTEAHTPSVALVAPAAGTTAAYSANVTFQFQFTDPAGSPGDAMTAYQLVLENNATGTAIFDSGKVLKAANSGTTVSVSVAIDPSLKNTPMRWRARAYDKGDTVSSWTNYSTFSVADIPVVTITAPPSALPVTTGSPTFSWSVTNPSGGPQTQAVVTVYNSSDNSAVWTTTVAGAVTSITPPVVILQNQKSYYFTVDSTDSTGLTGSATQNFSTSYAAPNSIQYQIDASGQEILGYVLIDWSQGLADTSFAYWKVYRRSIDGGAWELIAQISDVNQRTYQDFMLTAGDTYLWSVTQTATRSGALLESTVGFYRNDQDQELVESRPVDVDLLSYWLINPDDSSLSVKLPSVIKDDSTLEFESETYTIIGRGRHTDYGDELGYSGSLVVQIRGTDRPNASRQQLEDLRRANETYYLRTPFGRLFPVSLGDLGWAPLSGTGTSEMGDMTIPYQEVH